VKLDALAEWCAEQQLASPAEQVRSWLPKRAPDTLTLFLLRASAEPAPATDAAEQPQWLHRWQALRADQAESLVALAARAARERRAALAYELVTEAVRENPDQAQARKVLGYVRSRDAWRTPFEIRQLNANKVWHEKFGWLPKNHVARYEKGERYYRGRWMAAGEEASLRSDLARGWRIESDHYVISTNAGLEAGVALSRRLETLYSAWQQVFIGYSAGENELARRFEGRAPRRDAVQHNVAYYRTRDEYNAALRTAQPQIDMTLGIYLANTRTAYFFVGEDDQCSTVFHEATHQLFQETRAVAADVGRKDNFWIVEGIACYMESLAQHEGYCTLGGANAARMPAARYRLLQDGFYVPLAELVTLGMDRLQHDERIARLYSQCAGLSDFLMHDGGGRYREPLVRYLDAVYSGRATTRTLAELTGVSFETLDRQYRESMSAEAQADAALGSAR
jgi:hypothetical protein